ncbi:MAG TPA: hypothetical protein VHT25_04780 [Solirubrobacteraceae bacterium]|jgi:hypothetical protein|nr:hypothetical protein [Solirubrobacteraceae bacterium]
MRHFKIAVGLAAVALTVSATPALAHEFKASIAGKTHGVALSEQVFKFGPFKIKCQKASAKGLVAAGSSKTYAASVKYAKCLTSALIGASKKHEIFLGTRWLTPLSVEYHASGFVETGDGELEEEAGKAVIAGGSAELKVNTGKTSEGTRSECHLSWPEQTIPIKAAHAKNPEEEEFSAASYTNESSPKPVSAKFPDGLQHSIVISNSFKGIKFELEGEPCEEWGKEEGPEGGGGTYVGSFPQILTGGNLEFF